MFSRLYDDAKVAVASYHCQSVIICCYYKKRRICLKRFGRTYGTCATDKYFFRVHKHFLTTIQIVCCSAFAWHIFSFEFYRQLLRRIAQAIFRQLPLNYKLRK